MVQTAEGSVSAAAAESAVASEGELVPVGEVGPEFPHAARSTSSTTTAPRRTVVFMILTPDVRILALGCFSLSASPSGVTGTRLRKRESGMSCEALVLRASSRAQCQITYERSPSISKPVDDGWGTMVVCKQQSHSDTAFRIITPSPLVSHARQSYRPGRDQCPDRRGRHG